MRSNMNMFKIMVTLCICTFVFAADAVDGSKMTKQELAVQVNELPAGENNNVFDKPKSDGVRIEGINIHQNNVDIEAIELEINPNAEKVGSESYKEYLLYLAGDDQELINKINNSTFEAQEEGMEKEEEDSRNPGCPLDGGYGYYGSDNLPADCSTNSTTGCQYGGEIHTSTVVSGNTYTYSTCNGSWDSQLTLYDAAGNELAYSDDACGVQSEIVWTSTIDGDVYLEIDKYNCADFGSCIQLDVSCTAPSAGCDDATACNDGAAVDCVYAEPGFLCDGSCISGTLVTFTLTDSYGDAFEGEVTFDGTVMSPDNQPWPTPTEDSWNFCLADGSYSYTYTNSGCCSSENSWVVTSGGINISQGNGATDSGGTFNIGGPPPVLGCMDSDALNYNENANIDDGSCSYPGGTCDTAVALSLPAVNLSGSTCGSGDDYSISACNSSYMGGDDYVYEFTTTEDGVINASLANCSWCALHITSGCADTGTCVAIAGGGSGGSTTAGLPAGSYYLTISTWPNPQCVDYTLNVDVTYAVAGCMDPNAPQYNADAAIDDGSCSYPGMDCCYFGYCEANGYTDYTLNCAETSCYNYNAYYTGDGWCDSATACAEYNCDGGDCSNDCAGACNGSAVEDCADVCGGSAVYDDCGVCNGDGTSCACDDLTVTMCDSYGDGWDGTSITIGTWSGTQTGSYSWPYTSNTCETAIACIDMAVANTVTVGGGSYSYEHTWAISDAAGNALLEGGDPYSGCIGTGCPVYGCLLTEADNYNPFADLDDGSCNMYPGGSADYWYGTSWVGYLIDCAPGGGWVGFDGDSDGIADSVGDGSCDDGPFGAGADFTCFECDGGDCLDCIGDCLGSAAIDACGTCNGDCTETGGGCTDLLVNGQVFVDDTYGDTCAYYENGSDTPNYWCAYEFMDGVSAMDACCSCGGGELVAGTISCADPSGDTNDDDSVDVSDIILIVASILGTSDLSDCGSAASDVTGDGTVNVLDVIGIVEIIIGGARMNVEAPSTIEFIKSSNGLSYKTDVDGLVGFEMTIRHSSGFELNLSKNAYIADAKTTGDLTKIVVVNTGGTEIFTSNGDFEIVELLAGTANGAIEASVSIIPEVFGLSSAYPNPFNPTTSVELGMPNDGFVSVKVYNLMGQVVATLHEGNLTANTYTFNWNASNAASGMYFLQAETAGQMDIQKIMLMK